MKKVKVGIIVIMLISLSTITSASIIKLERENEISDITTVETVYSDGETWIKTYGTEKRDIGGEVQQTDDGGYIIAGVAIVDGPSPYLRVIKVDSHGEKQWESTFDNVRHESYYYYFGSIQQTTDGGYIVVGKDIIKLDENGNKQWEKNYHGSCTCVKQTTDGGYVLTGKTSRKVSQVNLIDGWILKIDENGDEEWNATYGEPNRQEIGFYSIEQTDDGGYIVAGEALGEAWILKADAEGNEQWEIVYDVEWHDRAYSAQQTDDGGYIITGYISYGCVEDKNIWLIKTDASGNEQWNRTFGGPPGRDTGYSVQQTDDGGYVIAGIDEVKENSYSFYTVLIKTNSIGELIWKQHFGPENEYSIGHSVQQTTDGGYVIAGVYNNDLGLIKTNADGEVKSKAKQQNNNLFNHNIIQRFLELFPFLQKFL